jgi:hypothetical protein
MTEVVMDIDVTKLPWWNSTMNIGTEILAAVKSAPDADPSQVAVTVIAGFVLNNVVAALTYCEHGNFDAGTFRDVLLSNAHPNAKPRPGSYTVPGQVGHA